MESAPWQLEWTRNLRSAEDLVRSGLIRPEQFAQIDGVLKKYRFSLPRYYADLIDPSDPQCPIRLQAIPATEENEDPTDLIPDPLADLRHRPAPRITHRYKSRVLLHLTPNCSLYCRYCFRKSLLNELQSELFGGELAESLRYIAEHPEIEEVILSGGDPLLVSDPALGRVVESIASISHLKRLRIHTRVPVTFPLRITNELTAAISCSRLPLVVVTHFNHAKEITPEAAGACARLKAISACMLNQSVLLRRVNDNVEALVKLSEGLFEMGVLPYYLHHPDRAAGTAAFDLSRERGLQLHGELRTRLSGYLVPRYVVDEVGLPYKSNVGNC